MGETKSPSEVWEETGSLLNTVGYDQCYLRRYSFIPPNVDVSRYVQVPFNFFLAIDRAKVALPDSVLKELELHTSKIKECLSKIEETRDLVPSEVVSQYEKICCALEELGIFLSEKILIPALRAHFPGRKEESQ